jgi:NAD+ synthase (glutamine-hydrolysing)
VKIALAQINFIVGHFEYNASRMIETIDKAKSKEADLVVFSELAVCGYMPHDLLEQHDFIEKCQCSLESIAQHCMGIAAIVGAPVINPNPKGKKLYNAACLLNEGKIETSRYKTLLPTYDIFDEYRYFNFSFV